MTALEVLSVPKKHFNEVVACSLFNNLHLKIKYSVSSPYCIYIYIQLVQRCKMVDMNLACFLTAHQYDIIHTEGQFIVADSFPLDHISFKYQ